VNTELESGLGLEVLERLRKIIKMTGVAIFWAEI
jgi:hypothetical protein